MVKPWSRTRWAVVALVMVALGVLLAFALDYVAENRGAIEQGRARDAQLKAEILRLKGQRSEIVSRAESLEQQVRDLGEKPVTTIPDSLPTIPPLETQGVPGRAPTQTEIDQAVASYCQSTGACTGSAGADASVSAAQVAAAVVAYCDPRGDCQGPRGVAGEDSTIPGPAGAPGQDGADSIVPGPQGEIGPPGPPPSAEAVAQAVADFCARAGEPCRGPAGPAGAAGERGPAGADGRGIASIVCDTVGQPITFTVTFTDGTTATFSCGGGPQVTP